jgi:peptidoglycan hydrolase-like protein with peptidoglycan-binding domain
MARSAKPLDESESWSGTWSLASAAGALLGVVARNPTLVGGSTAFLVAMSFVSANALWYQPYAHSGAFFATREFLRPGAPRPPEETTIIIERPAPPREVAGDAKVKRVQETLRNLNFYAGEVDGLYGPNTRLAIEAYQKKVGLAVTGAVDESLLEQLGASSSEVVAIPSPAPREPVSEAGSAATRQPLPRDERIQQVQVGLKEFGNAGIEVDGLMGAKTEAGIREFQSLFGLPVTGQADDIVYAKMKEIGLIE